MGHLSRLRRTSLARWRCADQDVAAHGADVGMAAESHRDVQFLVDDLERLGDPSFPHRAQAIDHRPADHRAARAQRPGLEL